MLVKRCINDDARVRRYLEYRDFEDDDDDDDDDSEEEDEDDDDEEEDDEEENNDDDNNLLTRSKMRIIQHCTQFLYSHTKASGSPFMSGRWSRWSKGHIELGVEAKD